MTMNKKDFDVLGHLTSLNILVAIALATAIHDKADARTLAFKLISSAEQQVADVFTDLKSTIDPENLAALDASARLNLMNVGALVDTFLTHMGAAPSSG